MIVSEIIIAQSTQKLNYKCWRLHRPVAAGVEVGEFLIRNFRSHFFLFCQRPWVNSSVPTPSLTVLIFWSFHRDWENRKNRGKKKAGRQHLVSFSSDRRKWLEFKQFMDTKKSKGNVLFWLLISAEVGAPDINDSADLSFGGFPWLQ